MRIEDRKFVFTVAAAFVVLTGLLFWRGRPLAAMAPAALAALLMLTSVLMPGAIPTLRRTWMAGGHAISRVTTPVILGVVYYLVLTPTGGARRLLGKSSLGRTRSRDTYWVARAIKARPPSDMRRQF